MKNFRFLFIAIFMCTFGLSIIAGNDNSKHKFQDTLNIKVDDNTRLMVVSKNLYHFEQADSIDKLVEQFNKDIMKIEYPEAGDNYIKIFYQIGETGSSTIKFENVTEQDKKYEVLKNGETFSPMPIELVMKINKANQISILLSGPEYFESLEGFKFGEIISGILLNVKNDEPEMRRKQVTLNWFLNDGKSIEELQEINFNKKSYDMISLSGTVGASLIRNRLVPSIDLNIGIIIGKKTYQQHMIRAEASTLYTFNKNPEGNYSTDINAFLGLSYYYNSSTNPDKPRWLGVGLSYLTWRNGNFFDENTWRFTVGARFGKHFSVMPELYISEGFKNVMPGLRIQATF